MFETSKEDRLSWAHSIPPQLYATSAVKVRPTSLTFLTALGAFTTAVHAIVSTSIFSGHFVYVPYGLVFFIFLCFIGLLIRPSWAWLGYIFCVSLGLYLGMILYQAFVGL